MVRIGRSSNVTFDLPQRLSICNLILLIPLDWKVGNTRSTVSLIGGRAKRDTVTLILEYGTREASRGRSSWVPPPRRGEMIPFCLKNGGRSDVTARITSRRNPEDPFGAGLWIGEALMPLNQLLTHSRIQVLVVSRVASQKVVYQLGPSSLSMDPAEGADPLMFTSGVVSCLLRAVKVRLKHLLCLLLPLFDSLLTAIVGTIAIEVSKFHAWVEYHGRCI